MTGMTRSVPLEAAVLVELPPPAPPLDCSQPLTAMHLPTSDVMRFVRLSLAALCMSALPAAAQQARSGPTVAVMYFNASAIGGGSDYESLRVGIADMLITELQSNRSIVVVERDALRKILEEQDLVTERRVDPETSARVGKVLGAQHMILGGFLVERSGRMRLDARAVNVETSVVEYVESVTGRSDDVIALVGSLAGKLNAGLKLPGRPAPPGNDAEAWRSAARASTASAAKPAASAFEAMRIYARALVEDDAKNASVALALYRQFLNETPVAFATSYRQKAESRVKVLSGGTD